MSWFSAKDQQDRVNFRSPDWFDRYLEFRGRNPLALDIPDPAQLGFLAEDVAGIESWSNPQYIMLLHSGLIYGFPFLYPFKSDPQIRPGTLWTTKLLLIDMILYSALQQQGFPEAQGASYEMALQQASESIRTFYRGIMTAYAGQQQERSIEHLLAHQVTFHRNWLDWRRTGINTHLFWDWYFFNQYLRETEQGKHVSSEDFQRLLEEKRDMKWLTMQVIIAAAHCDQEIRRREKILQHHFEKSAHFFNEREKERLQFLFRDGVQLAHLQFPELDWTARRYLLDISLLVVYADREIHEEEDVFLHQLMERLQLDERELIESQLALGGFLLRFGRKLPFLSGRKSSIALISKAMGNNFRKMRKATGAELEETKDMALTLGRLLQYQLGMSKGQNLPSEEEIAAAFDQIRDLPKFLPFFSLVFLPVPGITEMYILLAYSIERMSGETLRLLPSNFSKMVKGK